jgi:hypothetical protein
MGSNTLNKHQFEFNGKVYECIGEDKDWQITQFRFAIKDQQWVTLNNRINNQLLWGPNIKEVKV